MRLPEVYTEVPALQPRLAPNSEAGIQLRLTASPADRLQED